MIQSPNSFGFGNDASSQTGNYGCLCMKVTALESVIEFIDTLEIPVKTDVRRLTALLEEYGHELSMPYSKPIGNGLWELRRKGRPQIRILYGFCRGEAILVLGFKKQRSALRPQDVALARKRFAAYCA